MAAVKQAAGPSMIRGALWGALGFGLGSLPCGVLLWLWADFWKPENWIEHLEQPSLLASLGYGLMGAVGGVALGLALRDTRLLRRLVVTGVLGFGLGGLLNLMLLLFGGDPSGLAPVYPADLFPGVGARVVIAALYMLAFGTRGTIGGALLGLAVPPRHSVRILAVAGAVGFGLGALVSHVALNAPGLNLAETAFSTTARLAIYLVWEALTAAVGGAVLGAVVVRLVRPSLTTDSR